MSQAYNIYCDESCHLEYDRQKAMVLGALWCPSAKVRECNVAIRDIKTKYGLNKEFEIKWTKVSPAKLDFYRALSAARFGGGGKYATATRRRSGI